MSRTRQHSPRRQQNVGRVGPTRQEVAEDHLQTVRREAKAVIEAEGVALYQAQVAYVYPSGGVDLKRLHNMDDDDTIEPDGEETVRVDGSQRLEVDDWVWVFHTAGNSFVWGKATSPTSAATTYDVGDVGEVAEEGTQTLQGLRDELVGLLDGKVESLGGKVSIENIVPDEDGHGRLHIGIGVGTNQILKEGHGLDGAYIQDRSINDSKIAHHSIDFRAKLKNVPNYALREWVRQSFKALRQRVSKNEESIESLRRRVRVLENQ